MAVKISYADVDFDKVKSWVAANKSGWSAKGWTWRGPFYTGKAWKAVAGPGVAMPTPEEPPVPPGPPELPPRPEPGEEKEIAIQYESDRDWPVVEMLAAALKADIVKTPRQDYTLYDKIVVVGGQFPNSLFRQIVKDRKFVNIAAEDEGYIYIQRALWNGREVWSIAGWHEADTIDTAKYLRDVVGRVGVEAGMPTRTVRVKPIAETAGQKKWREYFENPDIVKTLGILPLTTQEAFTRVFAGYSIIDDKDMAPEPGHYLAVAGIVAGLAAAALGTAMGIMGATTGYAAPGLAGKYEVVSSTVYSEKALTGAALNSWTAAQAATTQTAINTAASSTGSMIAAGARVAPAATGNIFGAIVAGIKANPLLAILALTQLDFVAWALGFSPEHTHEKVERSLKNANSQMWALEDAIKRKEWSTAKVLAENVRKELDLAEEQMKTWPIELFEQLGFTKESMEIWFETTRDQLEAYKAQYPQLGEIPPTFPKEFLVEDVQVEDGDTLIWAGHPEAQDRIRIIGIDTHEAETEAGIEETEYLKSLIEHKQVTIKTHEYGAPEKTLDIYGRLLGGVFLGDQDIALAMLEHFGTAILTPSRYRDKYRWIDWDLYKRTAAAAAGPAVKEFKIFIDSVPSNAKLFIDGKAARHNTPSDEVELKDVMDMLTPGEHVIKATKGGKEASITVTILEGANPDIMLILKEVGLEPVEPEPVEPPVEEPPVEPPVEEPAEFSINILSAPLRAKLYIDGTYTHHLTPSNEKELSDVMELLAPGKHTIRVTKAGKAAEREVDILAGSNPDIFLTLEVVGLPKSKEYIEKEIAATEALLETLKTELAKLE